MPPDIPAAFKGYLDSQSPKPIPESFIEHIGIAEVHLYYAVIMAILMAFFSMISNLFRLKRDPKSYGWFTILNSLLLFLFVISATLIKGDKEYIIGGRFLFTLSFLILCLIYLMKKGYINIIISKEYFKMIIKFSLPTVVYSISAFLFLMSDRFLINHYLGKTEVGIYSGIFQLASIISIICSSFNAAWMPWLFDKLKTSTEKTYTSIVKISYLLMLFFIILCFIYSLVYSFLVTLYEIRKFV